MAIGIKYGATDLSSPCQGLAEVLEQWGRERGLYTAEIPVGMSRWTRFAAVCPKDDLATVLAASPANLVFTLGTTPDETVTLYGMHVTDYAPIDPTGELVRVEFADERYRLRLMTSALQWNMPVPDAANSYVADSTDSGTPWTLQDLADELFGDLGLTAPSLGGFASDVPDAVSLKHVCTTRAIDALLYGLGLVALYDPRTNPATLTIEAIGANSSYVDDFRDTAANENLRAETQETPKVNIPQQVRLVAERWNKTVDDSAAPFYSVADATGKPTDDAGTVGGNASEVALPAPAYAFEASGDTLTSNPAEYAAAYYERFKARNRTELFSGLKAVPLYGALDAIRYVLDGEAPITAALFSGQPELSGRPSWCTLEQFAATAHGGIRSRIDAFGRVQLSARTQNIVWVKFTGTVTAEAVSLGGGKYVGSILSGVLSPVINGDDLSLALADTDPDEVVILNDQEQGTSFHAVPVDWVTQGMLVGVESGKRLVRVNVVPPQDCESDEVSVVDNEAL